MSINRVESFIGGDGGRTVYDAQPESSQVRGRRPTVTVFPGSRPQAVDQAESALLARSEELRIFQRGGELVRIISLLEPSTNG